MSDFSDNRKFPAETYPVRCKESSGLLKRVEPLITPKQLRTRYLLGIPLKDFNDNEILKDRIDIAISELENEIKTTVFKELKTDRLPYDKQRYQSFVNLITDTRPIIDLNSLCLVGSNEINIFQIPPSWIDTGNFHVGQVNVIPILTTYGTTANESWQYFSTGMAFLSVLSNLSWIPSLWEVKYTTGLSAEEGIVPMVANTAIGAIAAIDILSNLASLNTNNSVSVGHDGMSQSSSGPGPAVYQTRINDLTIKKDKAIKQLKCITANQFYMTNI